MDRISIVGGQPLHGAIPISGAKNATLPLMIASLLTKDTLILDNVPRLADVSQLQRILNNHGVDIMVNGKRPGDTAYQGQTLHISAADIVDTTAPYELVSKMRASFWVIGPLVARMGEAKVSHARRLRHRHPPGRSPHHGAARPRRRDRDRRRLRDRARPQRPARRRNRIPQGDGRRHPYGAHGGIARPRHQRDRERGPRARDRRCRRLPQQDGRADFRRRHLADRDRGRAAALRRAPQRAARPHRDRHLCHGGRDGRRRRHAGRGAAGIAAIRPRHPRADRRRGVGHQHRHQGRAQRLRHRPGRCGHRAVPRLSHRPAGAVHGADDARARHLPHHRDDLREPLHACAGAGAARRPHPARRRHRDHPGAHAISRARR